jgi:hypothetical protein
MDKIRLWAAVKGYEIDELSVDEAAELAGLSKVGFLRALGQFGSLDLAEPKFGRTQKPASKVP